MKKSLLILFFGVITNLDSGDIAFRQYEGGHTVGPSWPYFIE